MNAMIIRLIRLSLVAICFTGCFSADDLPVPSYTGQESSDNAASDYTCHGKPVPYATMCDSENDIDIANDACTLDCKCGISNNQYLKEYEGKIIASSPAKYSDICYVLILHEMNWFDAHITCAQAGLQLAVLETGAELEILKENLTVMNMSKDATDEMNMSAKSVWIGAHRYGASDLEDGDKNQWRWLHGGTLSTDHSVPRWGEDEPNNFERNQDCVLIRHIPTDKKLHGLLDDVSCNTPNHFLCRTPVTL